MACHNKAEVLNAYLDGELDLSASLELEQHLQDCPMCASAARTHKMLAEKLRDPQLRHAAGDALRQRVAESLRQETPAAIPPVPRFDAKPRGNVRFWRTLALAAMIALAASVGFTVYREWGTATLSIPSPLATEVLSDHIRSLMAGHTLDVISTDQHTVKPWFMGKLDFSPAVEDLKEEGFPLIGGRLDYVANHPVAALVFQRRKHVINIFTWPEDAAHASALPYVDRAGYHVRSWHADGMNFVAVSDVGDADLENFVRLYSARLIHN